MLFGYASVVCKFEGVCLFSCKDFMFCLYLCQIIVVRPWNLVHQLNNNELFSYLMRKNSGITANMLAMVYEYVNMSLN